MMNTIRTGDIYMVDFAVIGQVERGYRPAVIVSNNVGNTFSRDLIVIPITSREKNMRQPTHVALNAEENGLAKDSTALCECPVVIPKTALRQYRSHLCKKSLRAIAVAQIAATATLAFLEEEDLEKAVDLSIRLLCA
jgi:mRNA interferase MazF